MVTRDKFIVFHIASRGRPEQLIRAINKLVNNIAKPKSYLISIAADTDDPTVYNKQFVQQLVGHIKLGRLVIDFATPKGKIAAMNRINFKNKKWDILVHLNDYVEIEKKGFDDTIRDQVQAHPKSLTLFPSSNTNGFEIYYLKAVSKAFYDKYGYIYHPELWGNFHRAELIERATASNTIYYSKETFFNFPHPKWFYGKPDGITITPLVNWTKDLKTFEKIKDENQPLH